MFDQQFSDLILQSSSLYLKKIPPDIFKHILSFLNLYDDLHLCSLYAQLEKSTSTLFRAHLQKIRLKQLLQHVIYGDEYKAHMILVKEHHLLSLSETVIDYSGLQ